MLQLIAVAVSFCLWVTLLLLILGFVFRRDLASILQTAVESAVSKSTLGAVVKQLPALIGRKAQERIASLERQLRDLREEKKKMLNDGWVTIGVEMKGFHPFCEEVKQGYGYFAWIQVNLGTGGVRAHPTQRGIHQGHPGYALDHRVHDTILGCPTYSRVKDDLDVVVMLGETYTYEPEVMHYSMSVSVDTPSKSECTVVPASK